MNQKFDIDELFRETLANATDVPPVTSWNHISGELDKLNGLSHGIAAKTGFKKWLGKVGVAAKVSIAVGVAVVGTTTAILFVNQKEKAFNSNGVVDSAKDNTQKLDATIDESIDVLEKTDESTVVSPESVMQNRKDHSVAVKTNGIFFDSGYIKQLLAAQNKSSVTKSYVNVIPKINPAEEEKTVVRVLEKSTIHSCKNLMRMEHFAATGLGLDKFIVTSNIEMASVKMYFGDGEFFESSHIDAKEFLMEHGYKVRMNKDFYVKSVVVFKGGCVDSAMTQIEIAPTIAKSEELIPNVFTPNGDGKNDEYFVQIADPVKYSMLILDMRKNKVFYSENKNESWKGNCGLNPCDGGFYEMILKLKYSGEPEMVINKRINLVRKGIE